MVLEFLKGHQLNMDEGGEVIRPESSTTDNLPENLPEEIRPENFSQISEDQQIPTDNVRDKIAQQINTLEQAMQQKLVVENKPTVKEKSFKLGKMLGLGALFTFLIGIWSSIKSMFGKGQQGEGY